MFSVEALKNIDGEEFSILLSSNESFKNNILRMLFYNQTSANHFLKKAKILCQKLINENPEVIVGAAKAGYSDVLVKIKTSYPEAMLKAFDYARALDPASAHLLIKYLPGVPANYEELGYSELDCAIISRNKDIVLIAIKDNDLFREDASGVIPLKKMVDIFLREEIEDSFLSEEIKDIIEYKFRSQLGCDELDDKYINSTVLSYLYNRDLLELADTLIKRGIIGLNGVVEGCGNLLLDALGCGRLDWAEMLLNHNIINYSSNGLLEELRSAIAASDIISSSYGKNTRTIYEYIPIIEKMIHQIKHIQPMLSCIIEIINGEKEGNESFIEKVKSILKEKLCEERAQYSKACEAIDSHFKKVQYSKACEAIDRHLSEFDKAIYRLRDAIEHKLYEYHETWEPLVHISGAFNDEYLSTDSTD